MNFVRELRRAPTLWVTPLIAFLVAWLALNTLPPGVAIWIDAGYGFAEARAVINPIAAGLLALVSGRRVRYAWIPRIRSAAISPLRPIVGHFLGNLAWILIAWGAAFGFVAVWMIVHRAAGQPEIAWLVSDVASLVLSGAVGYVLGVAGRGFWAVAPAVALSAYVFFVVTQPGPQVIVQLTPIVIEGVSAFVEMVTETLIGAAVWYVFAGAALLCFVAAILRPDRRHWMLLCSSGLVAVLGASLVVVNNGQATRVGAPPERECRELSVTICVVAGYSAAFASLDANFSAFNQRVDGTSLVASRLEHLGRGAGEPTNGWRSLYFDDLRPDYAQYALLEYVDQYSGSGRCDPSSPYWWPHYVVVSWLGDVHYESTYSPEDSIAEAWLARPDAELNAWLREHEADVLACRVTWEDLE